MNADRHEHEAMTERLAAMTERLREPRRADMIRRGIDPASTERTIEQIRAETIALRALRVSSRCAAWTDAGLVA